MNIQDTNLIHISTPESVCWVNDGKQITVINRESNRFFTLSGLEAVVWNWLSLGYSYQQIEIMTAHLLSQSESEAVDVLGSIFRDWYTNDLLEIDWLISYG